MAQLYANGARSVLLSSITAISTALQIDPAHEGLFPVAAGADWFKVAVEDSSGNIEYIKVQRATGQSVLTVMSGGRAIEDAAKFPARLFSAGAVVQLRLTAADLVASIAHPSIATDAHDATAISVTPAGAIAATDVQAALQELDSEKLAVSATTLFTRDLLNDADQAAARTTLGAAAAADVPPLQSQIVALRGLNKLLNGNFAVNQRAYVSGTATVGANQYTLDGWRVVTSGQSLTFTTSGSGRQITAPAGGVEHVILAERMAGGTHILTWVGTATATVNGAAVANGGTVSLPANTQATVRFTGGTVSKAQLEAGSVATAFEELDYTENLRRCQRQYFAQTRTAVVGGSSGGLGHTTYTNFPFPVEMWATPTFTFGLAGNLNVTNANSLSTSKWGTNLFAQAASAGPFSIEFNTFVATAEP